MKESLVFQHADIINLMRLQLRRLRLLKYDLVVYNMPNKRVTMCGDLY